nr:hypothetical protein [Tanacetum cinerariifolium]
MAKDGLDLLDRQALGAVRLLLAKNVAYNVVNEKTTYDLFKALSNMYEKPSASNKVFLIRELINMKMKEGACVTDHVNEFNSIISRLVSVDFKFDDEKGHSQNQCPKPVTSKDKEVHMAVRDYDDALVCCTENTVDDRIMDSGASFHATYCKEELEKFKLRSNKVYLADDKTLDITSVGDVVLKTSFGFGDQQWKVTKGSLVVARENKRGSLYMVEETSNGISVSIDGRGNAALWHHRLGHMSENGIKILASNGRILDLQKAVVGFCEPCVLVKQKKVSFVKSEITRKLQRLELVHTDVYGPTSIASIGGLSYYVSFIDDSSRKNGVAERMNRTLNKRAKNMRLHARLPKMFWENSVTTAASLINRRPSVPLGLRILEEECQGKEVSLTHLRVFRCDSYVKVKDVARDKLDANSVKCTFIGVDCA